MNEKDTTYLTFLNSVIKNSRSVFQEYSLAYLRSVYLYYTGRKGDAFREMKDLSFRANNTKEHNRLLGIWSLQSASPELSVEFFEKAGFGDNPEYDFYTLLAYMEMGDPAFRPDYMLKMDVKYNGDFQAFADMVYSTSVMASQESVNAFLENFKKKKYKEIAKDPVYILASEFADVYNKVLGSQMMKYYAANDSLQRIYMKGLMRFRPQDRYYPDANFTLRVTYGKVKGYQPRDAVAYKHFTTLEGIMEKEDPNIYDYVVEDRLKELYDNKDYGRYADKDGSMHVCFIATNHTSGGNSGSPLLSDRGELLGINFDRCWEGTMSDIVYDPEMCRNISIDIRYCLFIIDKFAGAGHLVDEMTIVE